MKGDEFIPAADLKDGFPDVDLSKLHGEQVAMQISVRLNPLEWGVILDALTEAREEWYGCNPQGLARATSLIEKLLEVMRDLRPADTSRT